jgi:hypothetical protein
LSRLTDLVWPTLESLEPDELADLQRANRDDVEVLQGSDWPNHDKIALEEARRIAAEEEDRRKTAEGKASNILLVVAALIPLLTYLETAIWDAKLGTAPRWLTLAILAGAVAYLAGASSWALRAIAVGTYHRIGPMDLNRIWTQNANAIEALVRQTLVAVRQNQAEINRKVSAVKMTHKFMIRSIIGFSLLLLVQAIAEIGNETGFWIWLRNVMKC